MAEALKKRSHIQVHAATPNVRNRLNIVAMQRMGENLTEATIDIATKRACAIMRENRTNIAVEMNIKANTNEQVQATSKNHVRGMKETEIGMKKVHRKKCMNVQPIDINRQEIGTTNIDQITFVPATVIPSEKTGQLHWRAIRNGRIGKIAHGKKNLVAIGIVDTKTTIGKIVNHRQHIIIAALINQQIMEIQVVQQQSRWAV